VEPGTGIREKIRELSSQFLK